MSLTQPRLTRRGLLRIGIGVTGATALSSCGDFGGGAMRLTSADSFGTPLAVPPLAEGELVGGVRVLELTAQVGTHDLGGATASPTWGFNGSYLGPTLRARVGERVRVRFTNDLDESTTVHWHGMHLPASMDGGPHQMVEPGDTWEPEWTIDQEPTTLWYHPHPHGETERHVYNGLAGMFLLDPPDGPHADLPSDYGVDDFPLVIQDKRLNEDGTLDLDDNGLEIGFLGDRVVANGTWGGHLSVTTERVRLRLLNGSTARVYDFGFRDDRDFDVVGTDGGLLAAPWRTSRVQLSPGERAEIVVRVRPRERVRLASFGAVLGDVVVPRSFGAEDDCDVLELRAADRLSRSAAVPAALAAVERLDDTTASTVREFVLEGREINGRTMDMDRIDEVVDVGATEVWEVRSRNPFPHNFHIHDVQFQVVSVDGGPPPPLLRGWKDTVYLEPHVTYRLVMRFEDYVDDATPYMYHCHLLLHEDDGMMGQFVVVEPGDEPDALDAAHSEH